MKLISHLQKFKTTIVFIHGFRKSSLQWNYSETNHPLLIEETLSNIANTILIDLTDEDYLQDITAITEEIYRQLVISLGLGPSEITNPVINTKIVLVAHSQGSFYCLRLAEMYPTLFSRLLLLDPTLKNRSYHDLLESKLAKNPGDIVERAKLKHFDNLPGCNLKNSVIVRAHVNISPSSDLMDSIVELDQLTNKNSKSRLVIHYEVSHMIHYKIPHVVIDAVKELSKI